MKIQAFQNVEVEISKSTRKSLALEYFLEKMDWKLEYFISEDGFVKEKRALHSSHSFEMESYVRMAREIDHSVVAVLPVLLAAP